MASYQEHKNVKIEKGNNLGFAKSFLTALDECDEADYYAFSDQDDVWEKDKLSTAIEILEEESQSTPLLYCSALQRVDENLNPLHVQSYHGLRINLPSMLTRGRLAGCTFVFNNTLRNLVKNSSQIEMHASHDSWVLLACLACGGNVFFDKKPHILFRRYNTNTSIDGGKLKSRLKYEFRYFEKYKNNRQKAQEEIYKLYEKEGVKPTGGCLTMIVPFLVLFGVFYAVAYPLTNTLHIDSAKVTEALNYVNTIPGYTAASGATNATYQEIYFLKDFSCFQNIDAIQQIFSADQLNTITMFEKGFNTFGMNLFAIPQDYGLWSPMILFPVICFASNVLTQFITMRINGKNNPMQQQQGCMKVMMYAMPLFSAYIAYIVPSAVAFYWIVSSLVSLVQSVIVGKLFSPQRMTATSEARHAALMFEQEALVQYNYVPHGLSESAEENTNSKKKKKK